MNQAVAGGVAMSYRSGFSGIGMVLLYGGLSCLLSDEAYGQAKQRPYQQIRQSFRDRPTVSPYTSLLNNGTGGAAMSYYNIIRPRQQAQKVARGLTNELRSVESNVKTLEQKPQAPQVLADTDVISTGRMQPTGHPTAFGSLGSYFPGAPQAR